MDVDIEHTVPLPEYLAAARLSIEEFTKPRLSELRERYNQKNEESKGDKKSNDFPKEGMPKGGFAIDPNAPKDKGYFVLITLGMFGLVQMLPFLFFFTANEYWMYKFRNTTSESQDANDRTYLQKYFSSLNSITVTTPGVICNFIAVIAGHKVKATTRVFSVLFVHSLVLTSLAIFVEINTDTWQVGFLIITLGSQLMMACSMSLGGSGSMGLIAKLPPQYMKSKLLGEGGAGVFSAVLRLVSIVITPSVTGAALIYFVTGSALMIITTFVFYIATRTTFFRHYTQSAKEDVKENLRNFKDIKEVLVVIWPLLVLMLFGIVIPVGSVTNLVVSEFNGTDNVWGNKYFVTVCTYLLPAIAGFIGRGLFNGFDIELSIPTLYVITLARETLFGALIFLSNAKPRHHLPIIVQHDWQYALVVSIQSLTSGFFMNLIMMKIMRMVPPNRIELAMVINMFFFSIFAAATSPLGVLAVSLL